MTKFNCIIITGASKGIGEGITNALINTGNHLICISRTENKELKEKAIKKKVQLDYIQYDLSYTPDIDKLMTVVFEKIKDKNLDKLILVNNAGVLNPIGPIETCDSDEIQRHISINLIAPMLLTKEFILKSKSFKCEKRILNLSSGAAVNPYFGWSSYCSGKAGLNMMTKCVAMEQQREKYPVKIMALAPGIIETDMQKTIRSTTEEQFPLKKKFVEFKETGKLESTEVSGKKISEVLLGDKFESGSYLDLITL
ncbi:MAG: (S)-benzoin forming benzil reductase [Bacteroidetes bacterium]|nr:(S)-benzoin forming benzil reductase [Bacteroidota bacterium]